MRKPPLILRRLLTDCFGRKLLFHVSKRSSHDVILLELYQALDRNFHSNVIIFLTHYFLRYENNYFLPA